MVVSAHLAEGGEAESCTGASQAASGIHQASAAVSQHRWAFSPVGLWAPAIQGMQKVEEAAG